MCKVFTEKDLDCVRERMQMYCVCVRVWVLNRARVFVPECACAHVCVYSVSVCTHNMHMLRCMKPGDGAGGRARLSVEILK